MGHLRWMAACVLMLFGSARAAAPTDALTPGDHTRGFALDHRDRSYLVHVPKTYDLTKPTPVVLAFHGALMNGPMMVEFSGLSRKADAAGFIVVYPNGVGLKASALFFNASLPAKPSAPAATQPSLPVDDVAFTRRLLDDLEKVANVDPRRIFATGMSNGGMMVHRVAAEMADRIAAAAPVAGTLALPAVHPSRPVPMIIFHGTADFIVPFDGPLGQTPATMQFSSVPKTIDAWRTADGCQQQGRIVETPDAANDGTTLTTTIYGPGAAGAEVVLVQVNGGGHTWPGMQPPVAFIGASTRNASANDLMWDFFCRHPMPERSPAAK